MKCACLLGLVLLLSALLPASTITDTFEDGTTQNWVTNLLGNGGSVPSPQNIATGGPSGAGDNYLLLTSLGGSGAGSRLTVINGSQWAFNYLGAGVTQISLDANNFGNTDLSLRLLFEDPVAGPPTNQAISTNAFLLHPGSGWTHITFDINPADLTAVLGSVNGALSNTTLLRLFHGTNNTFPGEPIVASLGVDNISATLQQEPPPAVPEPASLMLVAAGAAGLASRLRRLR